MAAWLALVAVVATLDPSPAVAQTGRTCSDPCLQAATAASRECVASAQGVYRDAVDRCLERDPVCVGACRTEHRECRDGTSLLPGATACQGDLDAAKDRCRARTEPGSRRRERCIDRAQARASRCRRRAAVGARRELRGCRSRFGECTAACDAGAPPEGPSACREASKDDRQAALRACRTTLQVTASACIEKDVTCVQACGEARELCAAPTRDALGAASAACDAQRDAEVVACGAANPAGGAGLDACVEAAQASLAGCRDAAVAAAAPGLATCTAANLECIGACPDA